MTNETTRQPIEAATLTAPVEPTGVMKDAGANSLPASVSSTWLAAEVYRAMIAVAPAAAQPVGGLLAQFLRCAYPVAPEINPRGYNWCEAWLDEARKVALAAPMVADPAGVSRRATDAEVAAWAERYDITNMLGNQARSAFEDAESLHMTYAATVKAIPSEALPQDEHVAFEAWAGTTYGPLTRDKRGFYEVAPVWTAWCAWKARSRLAATVKAVPSIVCIHKEARGRAPCEECITAGKCLGALPGSAA